MNPSRVLYAYTNCSSGGMSTVYRSRAVSDPRPLSISYSSMTRAAGVALWTWPMWISELWTRADSRPFWSMRSATAGTTT